MRARGGAGRGAIDILNKKIIALVARQSKIKKKMRNVLPSTAKLSNQGQKK